MGREESPVTGNYKSEKGREACDWKLQEYQGKGGL